MGYEINGATQPKQGGGYPKPPNTSDGVKLGGPKNGGLKESHEKKE